MHARRPILCCCGPQTRAVYVIGAKRRTPAFLDAACNFDLYPRKQSRFVYVMPPTSTESSVQEPMCSHAGVNVAFCFRAQRNRSNFDMAFPSIEYVSVIGVSTPRFVQAALRAASPWRSRLVS
jgi:hypothetical protein